MNVGDPAVRNAVRMANVAAEAREQFCAAFLAQTGLMPDQATMCYGKKMVGNDMVFQVWFEPNELRAELKALRDLAVNVAKGEADPTKAREVLLLYGGNQAVAGIEVESPPANMASAAQEIFAKLESYGFQCDGGDLVDCRDWKALKQLATAPLVVAGNYSAEEIDQFKQQLLEGATAPGKVLIVPDQIAVPDKIETLENYRRLEQVTLQFSNKLAMASQLLFELDELAPFREGKSARVGRVVFTHMAHGREQKILPFSSTSNFHKELARNNLLLINTWLEPSQLAMEYMIAGEQFELCAQGVVVPKYECTVIKDEESGECQFNFKKVQP